ncbi:hypothetical protein CHLNCDRAFT_139908 [Chlorella variabilis]|uniref:ATP-grasp domain-containing protein n=1 Tax=Chlorella variabilis TaxID=554065 RepID=E1ZR65_CHLVA|nr:hypothetical protein CHLNCDRAFT_139908 [Chlorella variabilis]EFN51726.1 hypothetical protein CHLNCDRAFT_139908 [Chlorella variabilis]|eukprot:XP_005843828.1 hypothetical protein CHLNCDRAFT_139908 [Chlorella variabilis]
MLRAAKRLAEAGSRLKAVQNQQQRFLNVHEYQGAQIMSQYGINVPPGIPVHKVEEVGPAAQKMADENGEVVVKSQILAGGRGLGKFTNGLQGGVHICKASEAPSLAAKMLGGTLSGAKGKPMVEGLKVTTDKAAAAEQIKGLYRLFVEKDCTMVEVNPLAETDTALVAADAKLGFDDNAAFRQPELFAMRDESQEDPREVAAAKYDLNYIGLDGSIGCMVNGAAARGAPANFLDVKAILVNIFGGIMRCDVIASGIVNAAKQVGVQVPLIVRLEGTNVERGKEILAGSGMNLISGSDLDDAAAKAVASIA